MTGDTPMPRAVRRAREALDAWESIPDVDPPGVEEAAMANALRDLVKHAELREQEHDHALNTILAQQNQIADLKAGAAVPRKVIQQLIDDLVAADREYVELQDRRRTLVVDADIIIRSNAAWIARERARDQLIDAASGVTS